MKTRPIPHAPNKRTLAATIRAATYSHGHRWWGCPASSRLRDLVSEDSKHLFVDGGTGVTRATSLVGSWIHPVGEIASRRLGVNCF